jgi:hypothetical protein
MAEVENKEQLQTVKTEGCGDTTPPVVSEAKEALSTPTPAAPVVSAPVVEEKKVEAVAPAAPIVEEKKVEAPVAEVKQPEVVHKEILSSEIKKTESELAVIKEVREELVASYAENKTLETAKEQLSKDLESTKTELKIAKEQLGKYMEAEKRIEAKKREERLSALSAKFKILGHEKSVEQLGKMDDATISEFETVVSAAIEKSSETKVMPEVTTPSQASVEKLSEKKETVATPAKPKVEQMTNDRFFKGVLKTLANEQVKSDRKTLSM